MEDFPKLLVCSQGAWLRHELVACLGTEDQQPKASRSRAALVLDGVLQAQTGSLVRCCGSSYCCPWG